MVRHERAQYSASLWLSLKVASPEKLFDSRIFSSETWQSLRFPQGGKVRASIASFSKEPIRRKTAIFLSVICEPDPLWGCEFDVTSRRVQTACSCTAANAHEPGLVLLIDMSTAASRRQQARRGTKAIKVTHLEI